MVFAAKAWRRKGSAAGALPCRAWVKPKGYRFSFERMHAQSQKLAGHKAWDVRGPNGVGYMAWSRKRVLVETPISLAACGCSKAPACMPTHHVQQQAPQVLECDGRVVVGGAQHVLAQIQRLFICLHQTGRGAGAEQKLLHRDTSTTAGQSKGERKRRQSARLAYAVRTTPTSTT